MLNQALYSSSMQQHSEKCTHGTAAKATIQKSRLTSRLSESRKIPLIYVCLPLRRRTMSDRNKAEWILAKLAMIHRPAALLDIEQILDKAGGRLDYYYFWIVKGGIS